MDQFAQQWLEQYNGAQADKRAWKASKSLARNGMLHKHATVAVCNYDEYIESEAWHKKRDEALRTWGNSCKACRSGYDIQVHHITYDNLGQEDMQDLMPLCRGCHTSLHKYHEKLPYLTLKAATWKWYHRR